MKEFQIIGMDHIVLNVSDIDRSLAFYSGTLGLKGERIEEFRRGEVGFPSVRIDEGTLIDLNRLDAGGDSGRAKNLNHFCLVAAEIDLGELVSHLKNEGVTITQEPVSRWGARGRATSVYVLDPDGNEVEIRCY
jgi:catechol 2,3-dioxygenase-like lactoylglutathione lyase family enzyme